MHDNLIDAIECEASREDGPERLRRRLINEILERIPHSRLIDVRTSSHDDSVCVAFEHINGEMIVNALARVGVTAATASACGPNSGDLSSIFADRDIPYSRAMGSIVFSGSELSADNVETAIEHLPKIVARLRTLAGI